MRGRCWGGVVVALVAAACGGGGASDDTAAPGASAGAEAGTDASPDGGTIEGTPGDTSLTVEPITPPPRFVQGTSIEVTVKIIRGAQQTDPVVVTLGDAAPGVTTDPLTIPPGASEGKLVVKAAADAQQGGFDAKVIATAGKASASTTLKLFVRGPLGSLDTTFGKDGHVVDLLGDVRSVPINVFVAADDSVYVFAACQSVGSTFPGSPCVAKLSADGAVDPAYGLNGVDLQVSVGDYTDGAALLQPDGKLLFAASKAGTTQALVRLGTDGKPDPTFGPSGTGVTTFTLANHSVSVAAIALAPDGTIVTLTQYNDGKGGECGVAKLSSSGALVTTFGNGGANAWGWDWANACSGLGVRADGRIWVVGLWRTQSDTGFAGAGIFELDGTSAGGGARGTIAAPYGYRAEPMAAAREMADGRVVVSFHGDTFFSFVRFASDARGPDTTFDADGIVHVFRTTTGDGDVLGIWPVADKVLATAWQDGRTGDLLLRLGSDGKLDTTFGGTGIVERVMPSTYLAAADVRLQKDGRIVVVSESLSSSTGTNARVVVSRYWGD